MKPFITMLCGLMLIACHKSETTKEQENKLKCGCDTDSIINVSVDSLGWIAYDSVLQRYTILDSVEYNFLNIFVICNPENKDVSSVTDTLTPGKPVHVYYSGKVKLKCPDSILTIPEVFLWNITIDSLGKM